MSSENCLSLVESLAPVIQSVLRRIRRWPTPSNWTRADWMNEERSVVNQAVCQTLSECAIDSRTSLAQAVYFQALSRALTRYRQEYLYSHRFLPETSPTDEFEPGRFWHRSGASQPTQINSSAERLAAALESLPQSDSELLQQIFWHERTQAQIARDLHISQRAVGKRKKRVLNALRIALQPATRSCAPQSSCESKPEAKVFRTKCKSRF